MHVRTIYSSIYFILNTIFYATYIYTGSSHDYATKYYGLNLKSLCQPAILPLSTDFLPSVKSLNDDYLHQGTYSLLINNNSSSNSSGNSKGVASESYNCVNEMICQRLSQVRNPFIDLGLRPGAYIYVVVVVLSCIHFITHY